MKTTPHSAQPASCEPEIPHADCVCKIVFFYENFDAAIHCRKSFDSIARSLGDGRLVEASSWSFSMLGTSEFNAAILLDGSRADVIVVAARGDRELPARVAIWIEMCVNGCGNGRPLLLALHADGSGTGSEPLPLCTSLEYIAMRQGTRAMCSRDLKVPAVPKVQVAMLPPRPASSPGILETGAYSTATAHRRWGIND
ncbi:MAG: hypothetical protein ABI318_15835 [Chthoniobacteraceae bacterium]